MLLLGVLLLSPQALEVKPFAVGEISTTEFESHPEFTLDGKTMYLVKSTPQFTDWKIYIATLKDGKWSKPAMAPFSGKYRDADPFITPDGKRMFFISDRPFDSKPKQDMDIWYMDRKGEGWGEAVHLGSGINSDTDEWFPTTTSSGKLYFGSGRLGGLGDTDIWISEPKNGKYVTSVNAGKVINTAGAEIEPFITPDEKMLIFNAVRPEGLGGLDFYVSRRKNGQWQTAYHLPEPLNSKAFELSPKLSRDGKSFFFSSRRPGAPGLGDIFVADARNLF